MDQVSQCQDCLYYVERQDNSVNEEPGDLFYPETGRFNADYVAKD